MSVDNIKKSKKKYLKSNRKISPELTNNKLKTYEYYNEVIDNKNKNIISKKSLTRYNFNFLTCIFGIGFFLFSCMNSYFVIIFPSDVEVLIINDFSHIYTTKYNNYFINNRSTKLTLITISSIVQDIYILIVFYFWIFKSVRWRYIITLVCFFISKQLCNYLITIKEPINYLYEPPLYNSLTMPVFKEYNFFFSGTIGLNLIHYLFLKYEFKVNKFIYGIALANSLFQCIFFLLIRCCYIIDVVSSLLMSHYFYYTSNYLEKYFNKIYKLNKRHISIDKKILKTEVIGKDELELKLNS